MSAALQLATGIARSWVRLYTSRMPAEVRDTRRGEIEADLWDQQVDMAGEGISSAGAAYDMLLRTLYGIPDDLLWRFEVVRASRSDAPQRRWTMIESSPKYTRWLGLCLVVGGILWSIDTAGVVGDGAIQFDLVAPLLLMVGLIGLLVQERERLGRAGRAGAVFVLLSWLSWVGMTALPGDGNSLHINLLAVAWAFLMPIGFVFMGIGMKGALRIMMFAIASLFPVAILMLLSSVFFPGVLTDWDMQTANSPPPFMRTFLTLAGLGLALMGYVAFRAGRTAGTASTG